MMMMMIRILASTCMCTGVESVEARARLRSATADRLLQPTTDTVTVGRRGFYYAGPATWNSLPPHMIGMPMSLFSFRKLLKTFLFFSDIAL